ncbi:BTAD domain-containing putative transcriptional regulator [Actinoplanes sp. GCM10030250]|uniref:BTAD domain-containing putative transcriptional regulator n=1 Tax=Actinoplanes sp. GCM10030250 TaxID=3273376 RepID=UPI0036135278
MLAAPVATPPRTFASPVPLTRFVGRETEVSALLSLLSRTRLVSLVGPGGSGKTRLAGVIHDRWAAESADTWWVPLAHLNRPAQLTAAVADVLGVAEVPGRSLPDLVAARLRHSTGLLVLDNCEHLVASCAALAGDLLRAAPGLRVVTTSREPLAVAGETTWPVRGLSLSADLAAPAAADLAGSQAVQLFTDRARLVQPAFAVTDANAADVARLCRRLDGMPLVLELAAARLRVLPLPRIIEWLDDAMSLLVTTNRDVPPRQATLRATLDWSHDLLPAPERELFARLSVFRGGFTVADATAVAGAGAPALETLDLLTRLVDKSLVQAHTNADEERYSLLEVIRQYAAERLGDQRPALSAAHARYMVELAEQAERELGTAQQRPWLDRLHDDHGNLRAALSWARTHDSGLGVRLAGALGRYWRLSGQYAEGRQWLQAATASVPGDHAAPGELAKALTALGTLEFLQCEYRAAADRLRRARDLYEAAGDDRGVAAALQRLGGIAREQGRYPEAWACHEEVLAVWHRLGEPVGMARELQGMGFTAWLEGDYARSAELCADAVRRFRELGDTEGAAGAQIHLAVAICRGGDPDAALPLLWECLAIADGGGLLESSAWVNEQLALIAVARGERTEAATLLRRSLAVQVELGDRWRTAVVLDEFAGICADAGTGARLLAAAERLRKEIGTPLSPADRAAHEERVRAVRAALSRADWERATTEGRALTLEQAVALATAEPVAPAARPPRSELSVRAFGRSAVDVNGRTLSLQDWTYAKPRELLYYLLTKPSSTKAEIGLALWPEASNSELRNSFHTCLKALRKAVGEAATVRFTGGTYRLEPIGALHYDVAEFQAAAGDESAGIEALTAAAERYPGDFLADMPVGGWAESHRAELRREYEYVLRRLGGRLAKQQRFTEAADVFARLVAHDPLLEAGHRALIRCYAALGEQGRALRQYDELVRLLDVHLGTRPAPETTELHTRLRERHRAA